MGHGTIRASTLKTIIPLIMDNFFCTENEALKLFYESHTGACYGDDSTGLYGQSANYVYSLFFEEKIEENNKIIFPITVYDWISEGHVQVIWKIHDLSATGSTEEIACDRLADKIVEFYSGKIKKENIEFFVDERDMIRSW